MAQRIKRHGPRTPVLCVLHHDGYVELFAGKNVDAEIAVMPAMFSLEGERLADDYFGLMLPRRFRSVYFPGLVRATGQVSTLRPQQLAYRKLAMGLLDTIDALSERDEVTTWTC